MDDDQLLGFRFYPTEEELVSFYLYNKIKGTRTDLDRVIPDVDIYDYNPWDLPQLAGEVCRGDSEQWFFFSGGQEREGGGGGRPNRLTREGYWKATGSPAHVYSSHDSTVIGRKRSMVYYVGRAPSGTKTSWKMNEYKPILSHLHLSSSSTFVPNSQLSLCRIYKTSRSLRAFDRRPPSEAAATGAHLHHPDDDDAALLNHPTVAVPERTDSLCLDNDQYKINPAVGGATEPSWDSDQLMNWFDSSRFM